MVLKLDTLDKENPSYPPFYKGRDFPPVGAASCRDRFSWLEPTPPKWLSRPSQPKLLWRSRRLRRPGATPTGKGVMSGGAPCFLFIAALRLMITRISSAAASLTVGFKKGVDP